MEVKLLEVRDRMTLMPVLAIRPGSESLFRRAGFGENGCIILVDLITNRCTWDAFDWPQITPARTLFEAHKILDLRWGEFSNDDVLDVEFELGETQEKKRSECR
jgi:hypothetical protein